MQKMRTLNLLATTSAVAAFGWTSAALAQGASTATTSEPVLEEIVVTASKRSESIQDTPVAVSAIGGDRLNELGATEFEDYFRLVPGLQAVDRGPGEKRYILRGVNNESGTRGGAPIVQQYLDELPLTLSATSQPDIRLYDIERVEVLRGPQGTLYGSGSMGGTVKTITRKPDLDEVGGSIEGTVSSTRYGSENFLGNAVINFPLVEGKLAARAVVYGEDHSGFIDNITNGNDDVNQTKVFGGRATLRWKPSETADINLMVLHQDLSSDGSQLHAPGTQGPTKPRNFGPQVPWFPAGLQIGDLEIAGAIDPTVDDKTTIANLLADIDFGWATLTSSSSYYTRKTVRQQETWANVGYGGFLINDFKDKTLSQELRLANDDGAFKWLVGAYYLKNSNDPENSIQTAFRPNGAINRQIASDVEVKQTALFGEVSYDILTDLTATVGLRWGGYDIESGFTRIVPLPNEGAPGSKGGPFTSDEDTVTSKFQLSYKASEDTLLYATVSEGFRAGGFNDIAFDPSINPTGEIPQSFGSDSLWNYELGAKLTLLDGRATFNTAVFYIDWSDIQVSAFDSTRRFQYQTNAGSASIYGLEAEVAIAVTDGLTLSLSGAYTDSRLTEDQPPAPGFPGKDGDRLPTIPKVSGAASLDYRTALTNSLNGFFTGTVSYTGNQTTQLRPEDPAYVRFDAYTLANVRIGVAQENWRVALFVDNLTDTRAELAAFRQLDWTRVFVNRPRTFGITAGLNF